MEVVIKGPSEVKMNMMDNLNGLCTVEYIPDSPGLYEIMVYYGDKQKQIPGVFVSEYLAFRCSRCCKTLLRPLEITYTVSV